MKLRSLLFVPGDSPRKMERAMAAGADVLILDLEDAVAPERKAEARARVTALLGNDMAEVHRLWVRINGLDSDHALADLAAVIQPGLEGIVLPKAAGAGDMVRLGHYLDALEAKVGMAAGAVRILPIVTETPGALFVLGGYAPAHPRLAALSWGGEDLATALGARANRAADGSWSEPFRIARTLCLFAAGAAGVAAIDTIHADFRDLDGLAADCRRAWRDGFSGRLAIHPDQVPVINAAFTPDAADIAHAHAIVAAFTSHPGAGVLAVDGRMVDVPHLKAARRLLAGL